MYLNGTQLELVYNMQVYIFCSILSGHFLEPDERPTVMLLKVIMSSTLYFKHEHTLADPLCQHVMYGRKMHD